MAPPPASTDNRFGASLAVSAEWAIVGAPGDDQQGGDAGVARLLHRVDGQWLESQTLLAPATNQPQGDHFGYSVAMSGDFAFVGSRLESVGEVNYCGAVHVYQRFGDSWQHVQQLIAASPHALDEFGWSVAAFNDVAVVGAPQDDTASFNAGAVHVFRRQQSGWNLEQTLIQTDGPTSDSFGASVAVSENVIAVGAPARNVDSPGGAAYVFRFDGNKWFQEQRLLPPANVVNSQFGTSVCVQNQDLCIGAPKQFIASQQEGAVHPFVHDGRSWTPLAVIVLPQPHKYSGFGRALAVESERLVIGVPGLFVRFSQSEWQCEQGGVVVCDRASGTWIPQQMLVRQPFIDPSFPCRTMANDRLGAAVAIDQGFVLAGAPMYNDLEPGEFGLVLTLTPNAPGCDFNGFQPDCNLDCNTNKITDSCELADGTAVDCNTNGVPDECDAGFDYVVTQWANGICYGTFENPKDFLWMMRYTVVPGGQNITHISIIWTPFAVPGLPATALLYSDPNQDGSPTDAQLLATAPTQTILAFNGTVLSHSIYKLPTTFVGEIGDHFFVGMHMDLPPDTAPALAMGENVNPPRRWIVSGPPGTIDINNPLITGNVTPQSGSWALGAVALDCDANGTWDQCDIDANPLLDLNNNGILDSCDLPCSGDIAGGSKENNFRDGTVAIDDLIVIINHWDQSGPPGTVPGDIAPPGPPTGDGIVNIDDLLIIVNTWGTCP